MYVYIYTYIHTHTHMYTNVYTYIYIHLHILRNDVITYIIYTLNIYIFSIYRTKLPLKAAN